MAPGTTQGQWGDEEKNSQIINLILEASNRKTEHLFVIDAVDLGTRTQVPPPDIRRGGLRRRPEVGVRATTVIFAISITEAGQEAAKLVRSHSF